MTTIDLTAAIEAATADFEKSPYLNSEQNSAELARYREGAKRIIETALPHIERQYVKPSREELVKVLDSEFGPFLSQRPFDPRKFWGQSADAILALLPGKAEAEVLRDARDAINEAAAGIAYHESGDEDLVRGMFDAATLINKRADAIERGEGL